MIIQHAMVPMGMPEEPWPLLNIADTIREKGSNDAVITLPPGRFLLTEPLKMKSWKRLTIQGSGQWATSLIIGTNSKTHVDFLGSHECTLQNIRIYEAWPAFGTRTCAGIVIGGKTPRINNVFLAAMKYGIFVPEGAGLRFSDVVIEMCDWGMYFESGKVDEEIGITTPIGGEIGSARGDCRIYKCKTGIEITGSKAKNIKLSASITNCNANVINTGNDCLINEGV